METLDYVAAVVASDEELQEAARRVGAGEISGAVLLDPPALQSMQHAGLFATAIFNPFGPTVETVSLASFDGDWHEGHVLLLRRSLNPFADAYIQVLAFYPGLRRSWDDIGGDLARFVANNGMRPHTKDWARPLYRTLPTGIITTGLAHDVGLVPEPRDDAPWFEAFEHAPSFERWWGLATHEYYQSQLYVEIPRAWSGSQGPLPGLQQALGDEDDDFPAWWALFGPGGT